MVRFIARQQHTNLASILYNINFQAWWEKALVTLTVNVSIYNGEARVWVVKFLFLIEIHTDRNPQHDKPPRKMKLRVWKS